MRLYATKALKNLNGSFLFFFLILFTAPLGADDVISGNVDDERRRTGKVAVAVNIPCHGEPSSAQVNTNTHYDEIAGANIPDNQAPNLYRDFQAGIDRFGGSQDQHSTIEPFSNTANEFQPGSSQWIGTVISETGPPSFPDNSASYHAGYENNGRLPQVARIETPVIISENIVHRIHSKTASVRTPTGPPDTPGFNLTSRIPQTGTISSKLFATPDFPFNTRIYSRSMQAILRGDRLRMLT